MDRHPNRDSKGHFIKKPDIDNRICFMCKSTETYIKRNGGKDWRRDNDNNIICKKCWLKFVDYPVRGASMHAKYNPRRITFLGKVILLSWDFRRYFCSWCNKNSGRIDMHHYFYVPCMPWACTVELCGSCHDKEKWRLGEFKNNTGWYQKLHPKPKGKDGKFIKLDKVENRL